MAVKVKNDSFDLKLLQNYSLFALVFMQIILDFGLVFM